jgi:cell wall-associated NlpC family hydrolase
MSAAASSPPRAHAPWRAISATLDDLPGKPWERGGRGPGAYDCWGLVLEVRRRLALPLPPDFASGAFGCEVARRLFHDVRPPGWVRGELCLGGILLAPGPGHAGILVGARVLHAQAKTGVVAWSLGHWAATFGDVECWQCLPPRSSC